MVHPPVVLVILSLPYLAKKTVASLCPREAYELFFVAEHDPYVYRM
jgi:hypothetical protein